MSQNTILYYVYVTDVYICIWIYTYRLLKMIGLFCKRDLRKSLYSAKNVYVTDVCVCPRSEGLCMSWTWVYRLLKIIGLFCKRALQKRLYSAQECINTHVYVCHRREYWCMKSVFFFGRCTCNIFTTWRGYVYDAYVYRNWGISCICV